MEMEMGDGDYLIILIYNPPTLVSPQGRILFRKGCRKVPNVNEVGRQFLKHNAETIATSTDNRNHQKY